MKITVGQFQDIYKISNLDIDDLDKNILMVQAITGKSTNEINDMPAKKFKDLSLKLSRMVKNDLSKIDDRKPQKFIVVNRRMYQLHYDITRMTSGRYVEAATFSTDPIGNLHKIMATMAVPVGLTWRGVRAKPYDASLHEQIAADMKEADFSVAYHAMVFFYAVFNESMKILNTSGNPQERELMEQSLRLSERLSGGSITARWYLNLKEYPSKKFGSYQSANI